MTDWELDLLTAILRIEQIADLNPDDTLRESLLDRLVTCDAPRLRRYLSPTAAGAEVVLEAQMLLDARSDGGK